MKSPILVELDLTKKRLNYYTQLKSTETAKAAAAGHQLKTYKSAARQHPLDKWIEIYAERVKKLEKQANRLGATLQ